MHEGEREIDGHQVHIVDTWKGRDRERVGWREVKSCTQDEREEKVKEWDKASAPLLLPFFLSAVSLFHFTFTVCSALIAYIAICNWRQCDQWSYFFSSHRTSVKCFQLAKLNMCMWRCAPTHLPLVHSLANRRALRERAAMPSLSHRTFTLSITLTLATHKACE